MKFSTFSYDPQISLKHNSFVLTCDEMKYQRFKKHFSDNNIPQPFKVWNKGKTYDANGCLNGHNKILKLAKKLNLPYCTIFEDDAYPRVDCFNRLEKIYFPNLLNNFDILFLGWNRLEVKNNNILDVPQPKIFPEKSKLFYKARSDLLLVGAHAYIVKNSHFSKLIYGFDNSNNRLPRIADTRLSNTFFNSQFILESAFCQAMFPSGNHLSQTVHKNDPPRFYHSVDLITEFDTDFTMFQLSDSYAWVHFTTKCAPKFFKLQREIL